MTAALPNVGVTLLFVTDDEAVWEQEAALAEAVGVASVELRLEYPYGNDALTQGQIRKIKSLLRRQQVTLHAPTGWASLINPHPKLRHAAIEELKDTLVVGAELGAKVVTFHGGALDQAPRRPQIDVKSLLLKSLDSVMPLAQILHQTMALENVPTWQGNSRRRYPAGIAEVHEVLAQLPDLRATFDLSHAVENGEDLMAGLQALAARLVNVHLHDFLPQTGGHKELGSGQLRWTDVMRQLRAQHYQQMVTLEIYEEPDRLGKVQRSLQQLHAAYHP